MPPPAPNPDYEHLSALAEKMLARSNEVLYFMREARATVASRRQIDIRDHRAQVESFRQLGVAFEALREGMLEADQARESEREARAAAARLEPLRGIIRESVEEAVRAALARKGL